MKPALLVSVAHESAHVVLNERRQVLRRQVVEDLDKKQQGLSEQRERGIRR